MANYLVQDMAPSVPGCRFRVVKTKMEVFLDKVMEVIDISFDAMYFSSRKEADASRKALVANSVEPIFGTFSLLYVKDDDVAKWLCESGRHIGIENRESWFDSLSKEDQGCYRIQYAEAKAIEAKSIKVELVSGKVDVDPKPKSPKSPSPM